MFTNGTRLLLSETLNFEKYEGPSRRMSGMLQAWGEGEKSPSPGGKCRDYFMRFGRNITKAGNAHTRTMRRMSAIMKGVTPL